MDGRPLKMQAGGVASTYDTAYDAPAVRDTPVIPPPPTPARTARERPAPPAEDPFRLGWRYRATTKDGREDIEQIPLTPEDLLNPREGDVLSDGFPHNTSVLPLGDALQRHLHKRPGLLVTCGVVLTLEDGTNCAPDIAVIEGDIDTSKIKRAVKLRDVGGSLIFALEAVSTSDKEVENKDIKSNVKRYAARRVPEYLTFYPVGNSKVKGLVGRRLPKHGDVYRGKYRDIAPDAQSRVYSEKLDLFFVIDKTSEELVAYDATTGQKLLNSKEEEAARVKAEAERAAAERRLAEETEARRMEAEARLKAEEEKKQEAEARRKAEQAKKQEAEARRKAEQAKKQEAEARRKAEQLNREMMAELEELRVRLSEQDGQ